MRFRLVLLAFAAVFGCHREPPPPPTLDLAEPAAIPGAEKVTCRIGPKQTILPLDDAGLHVHPITSQGNKVSFLGSDLVQNGGDVVFPEAVARIADARAGLAWSDFDAKATSADGQSTLVKVSMHVDGVMNARIEAGRGKPMLFPGETSSPSANKIAWVHPDGEAPYVIGEGRWRDIDLVAFDKTDSVLGNKACGSTPNGWNETTLLASHTVSHVELYERRTGKRIDETTIESPDRCPNDHDTPPFRSAGMIRAWVASKLAP